MLKPSTVCELIGFCWTLTDFGQNAGSDAFGAGRGADRVDIIRSDSLPPHTLPASCAECPLTDFGFPGPRDVHPIGIHGY